MRVYEIYTGLINATNSKNNNDVLKDVKCIKRKTRQIVKEMMVMNYSNDMKMG